MPREQIGGSSRETVLRRTCTPTRSPFVRRAIRAPGDHEAISVSRARQRHEDSARASPRARDAVLALM